MPLQFIVKESEKMSGNIYWIVHCVDYGYRIAVYQSGLDVAVTRFSSIIRGASIAPTLFQVGKFVGGPRGGRQQPSQTWPRSKTHYRAHPPPLDHLPAIQSLVCSHGPRHAHCHGVLRTVDWSDSERERYQTNETQAHARWNINCLVRSCYHCTRRTSLLVAGPGCRRL